MRLRKGTISLEFQAQMEAFKESGPRAALKIFEKKLREQSSEFRYLSDDGTVDQDFENEAYELQYTDSPNKIRNINRPVFFNREICCAILVPFQP